MGGKSSTTTQSVEIPPEVREQYKQVIARANQITQRPFQAYSNDPTAFVAPLTATQQAGIANINAVQGMAQPSVDQGQGMIMRGVEAGVPLQYQSLGTAAQGREVGSRLFDESLGTAASGTGQAQGIYGRVLPEIQRAAELGESYGVKAQPYLESGLGAASPYMSRASDYTTAGLGAGTGMGLLSADYLSRGTRDVSPTEFSGEQIDRYMSPYMKNVVAAQQALQAEEAGQQRSALRGQQIAAGAFGGDRGGIAQANLARQQSLANQATLSNLLQGGYGQALGAFQQQQGTRLAAEQANRAAQQFGSQQAAALGQQLFGQNLAAGSQLANIGQALFGQNISQGQALAALGQQLYGQRMGGAQAAAGIGTNLAAMKAQEAALQQQAAQGKFGQAAQEAALQQAASQNVYNMATQGGMNYANLGLAGQAAALQAAQAQLGAGQIEQQTEQAAKSAMYNQFLQQQGYPYQQVGFLGNVSMGIGSQSGGTTTTQQGSYSDRRLKEDIRKVGETFDGQPIYSFKYKGEEKSQLGLIAQEVEKDHPEAVGERDGYLTVDYKDATEDAANRGHFASGGLVPSRMGGAVTAPGDYARGGYADGGDAEYGQYADQSAGQVAAQSGDQTAGPAPINPEVKDIYQKYLFRDPTADEGTYWQNRISQGTPLADVDAGIAGTRERQNVNPVPLTYNPANFGTGAAPVQNRYGFYAAPMSSMGSSFTPQAIAARQTPPATATGKGASSSSYLPSDGSRYGAAQPVATGKGPSAAPSVGMGSYATPPVATGKGASTNAYTGSNYTGMSGAPTATGKGPSARGYASGGRVAYAGGGASDLRDYIDMMSGSPKGLAMAHAGIFKIPGERADITKYTEGMARSRGSNLPQPGRVPEPRNALKEAAETGTNIAKIAEFGTQAKNRLQQMTARPAAGTTTTTTAPASEAPLPAKTASAAAPQVAAAPAATSAQMAGDVTPMADTLPDVPFSTAGLEDFGSLFAANGGRIKKAMAGAVGEDDGSMDPSEGAYKPVGAGLDIEFKPPGGNSFAKDATQRLLKGGSGVGGGGGQSPLGGIAQAAQIGMTAFKVGQTIAAFLPMIFSDERLKKNAKPIGRLYDGQTVYRFDMGGETKIGLIAQEVEKEVPEAVGLAGKYKAVDYELATAKAAKRGHFALGGAPEEDITEDPVADTIRSAGVAPSEAMTVADATPREEREPAPAPVRTAGLSPSPLTGVEPPPVPSRAEGTFARMLARESNTRQFDPSGRLIVGRAGEEGISQIQPAAAREAAASLGIDYDPERVRTDPDYNMKLGKTYFNMQMDRFGGDPMIAAAAYNAGPTRVARALETAREKGGDFLDYLPVSTVRYLSAVSDAAQGAHERLLARQQQVEAKAAEGAGPAVVDAPRPDGLAGAVAQATETKAPTGVAPPAAAPAAPGLGGAMGRKSDWEMVGSKILPDAVPKSADFWVPLIAAVGGMLGARAPNLANAIGAGLTSGAAAFMAQREAEERVRNQAEQRAIQRQQLGLTEREVMLKESEQATRRKAMEAVASVLGSGNTPAPRVTPPVVTPQAGVPAAGASAAPAPGRPTEREGDRPVAAPPEVAPPKVEIPQIAPPNSRFWDDVEPMSNPSFLDRRASEFDNAAAVAAQAGSESVSKTYADMSKQYRAQASSIRQSGQVTLKNGSTAIIPGFAESRAALTTAEETARERVKKQFMPEVTPEGAKIIPPESAAAAAGAPSTLSTPPAPPADRPRAAAFDPAVGKLKTAIPSAPAGGGFQSVTGPAGAKVVEQSATNKAIVENDTLFAKDFMEKLPKTDVAISRYKSMANAFKLSESGRTAEALAAWAAFAESYGMQDVARRITNNDPAAVELIQKEAPNLVLETLSAANPRFAQSEFLSLKDQGTPSPDKLPRTNFAMVSDGLAVLERQKAFAQDWQLAQQEGWRSPSAFWNAWSQANPMSQFQLAARRQLGNFKGMDLPAANEWTPGAIYVAPTRMPPEQAEALAKRGVRPGDLFRFNGWNAETRITPIDKSKGFEAYLERQ